MITLLEKLIATPRTSRNETEAADLLQSYMQDHGLEPQRHGNNLWDIAPGYDAARPTLLLNAHIDTVQAVNGWQHNPFTPVHETVDGRERIYGLGSNDDGASLVALLTTYIRLRSTDQSYNLIFLASAEEEVSGQNGISSVLPVLPKIDVALVGEPTGMQPAIAEKGLMVLDCTAHGKSGHAARNEGDNAIYRALTDIEWFQTYKFDNQTDLLGPVKMTVTIINAGTQHNVIPDQCTFTVDVRSNECYANEDIYNIVRAHVKSDVKARSFRLNSSRIDVSHPLVERCITMGKEPFGSPTLSDQALMSFPSMKMGPGDSRRSHTADEYIIIDELEDAVETYFALLNNLTL